MTINLYVIVKFVIFCVASGIFLSIADYALGITKRLSDLGSWRTGLHEFMYFACGALLAHWFF